MTAVAAKRECVRQLQAKGLSERQACRLVGISTSVLRYQPRTDGNETLRERLKELAGQHRRHGYRMLHNRLRHEGWAINVKRTWRVYREEGLAVRKRRRKKLPVTKRQPLVRPEQPNEVWSMDFVFDELANGRKGWGDGTFKLERHLSSAFVLLEVVFSALTVFGGAGSLSADLVSLSATA